MDHLKLKFWINLGLMMATTYVVILYIFTPSKNQCQMTFMMEPPKFIPIPVDNRDDDLLFYSNVQKDQSSDTEIYKLFMYSEFGFPQESNIRRDLKDSMPVLFVPGNAGSYQQVRSLASTCIRRQMQSLEAYKFIFYSIDFGGQLSGLDGQLVMEQTLFVSRALQQIKQMHPTETKGVILIGHSVGGFISKALFTLPNFDPSSVPLLISLASPLVKPYLTFDDEMKTLYSRTNEYWNRYSKLKHNRTTSISISGGRSDRLVPMHLSFDPNYDLSLTTSSIRDVWLETDHVSVTWCKELMKKLSQLLSAVMDKKQTQVISDKSLVLSLIRQELLLGVSGNKQEISNVISRDWRSMRPYTLMNFNTFSTLSRSQLIDSIIVVNVNSSLTKDLLIVIDHLDSLRENKMFRCQEFLENNTQINCVSRMDLIESIQTIPTRNYEPRRSVLKLKSDANRPYNYLVFDFSSNSASRYTESKLPEMISMQELDNSVEKLLYIPNIFEFIMNKLFLIDNYRYKMEQLKKIPLAYDKYRIVNLVHQTQAFSISFKAENCRSGESSGATIILSQVNYISQSFHTNPNPSISIKLVPRLLVEFKGQRNLSKDTYLEFYIDGTCDNQLYIEFDLMGLVVNGIQESLDKILTCAFYLAYASTVFLMINLHSPKEEIKESKQLTLKLLGLLILYLSSNNVISKNMISEQSIHDAIVTFTVIWFLSQGIVTTLGYLINRILDLATIINNAQSTLRLKFNAFSYSSPNNGTNGAHKLKENVKTITRSDFGWLLVTLAVTGSFVLSEALISLFMLFIVIKSKLSMASNQIDNDKNEPSISKNLNRHFKRESTEVKVSRISNSIESHLHELIISIATLCALALISDIPALIKIPSIRFKQITLYSIFKLYSFVSSLTICYLKKICDRVGVLHHSKSLGQRLTIKESLKAYLFCIPTILLIPAVESNMCSLKIPLMLLFGWIMMQLKFVTNKEKID